MVAQLPASPKVKSRVSAYRLDQGANGVQLLPLLLIVPRSRCLIRGGLIRTERERNAISILFSATSTIRKILPSDPRLCECRGDSDDGLWTYFLYVLGAKWQRD